MREKKKTKGKEEEKRGILLSNVDLVIDHDLSWLNGVMFSRRHAPLGDADQPNSIPLIVRRIDHALEFAGPSSAAATRGMLCGDISAAPVARKVQLASHKPSQRPVRGQASGNQVSTAFYYRPENEITSGPGQIFLRVGYVEFDEPNDRGDEAPGRRPTLEMPSMQRATGSHTDYQARR